MRVLLAFDKFKDCLSARHACELVARELKCRHPDWTYDFAPLADGGEGFAEILTASVGGRMESREVTGPRGEQVTASFGLVSLSQVPAIARSLLRLPVSTAKEDGGSDGTIALIEMAAASGLALLPQDLRDPWRTTTFGTGELMRHATDLGAKVILLGVGGSANNDLGLGALEALGLRFEDGAGGRIHPAVPLRWAEIARIEDRIPSPFPAIRVACDVTNPLLGPQGAAAVYGAQKGLRLGDFAKLDEAGGRVARMLCGHCQQSEALITVPGAGAAGGLPFGLMAAAKAQLLGGFDLVAAWLDLEPRLAAAELVITGEGRFDDSSRNGKGPGAVVARAMALGKTVHVFAGSVASTYPVSLERQHLFLHAITPEKTPLPDALRDAAKNLAAAVQMAFPR